MSGATPRTTGTAPRTSTPANSRASNLRPNDERRRIAAANAAAESPSPKTTGKKNSKTPSPKSGNKKAKKKKAPDDRNGTIESDDDEGGESETKTQDDRIADLEKRLLSVEEEKTRMEGEIWGLKDRLQEVEWQNQELERKLRERREGGRRRRKK